MHFLSCSNRLAYTVAPWAPARRYATTLGFLICLIAFWWVFSWRALSTQVSAVGQLKAEYAHHQKEALLLSDSLESVGQQLAGIQHGNRLQESAASTCASVMHEAISADLAVQTCSTKRNEVLEDSNSTMIELIVQGNFDSFIAFLTLLEQASYPISIATCTLTRQHDTLLDGKILLRYGGD